MAIREVIITAFLVLSVAGTTSAMCSPECDDVTELCVEVKGAPECQCRPSLYRVNGQCIETVSYSTDVQLTGIFEWLDILEDSESEAFGNYSDTVCGEFDSAIGDDISIGPPYYGCEVVVFYEVSSSRRRATSGAVGTLALSLFNVTLGGDADADLQDTLRSKLPSGLFLTSTLITAAADECEDLGIHDCDDDYGSCDDTGADGFNCSCDPSTEDNSPNGLTGRNCEKIIEIQEPDFWIVYTALGASLFLFIVMLVVIICVSRRRDRKGMYKGDDSYSESLDSALGGELEIEGVMNQAFDPDNHDDIPDAISDIDDEQLAKLTQLQLAIERASQPISQPLMPHVEVAANPMDEGSGKRTSAIYSDAISPQLKHEGVDGGPEGEYMSYIAPSQPQKTKKKKKPKMQKTPSLESDQPAQGPVYASTLPDAYQQGNSMHPEPSHSRQSSTVFLPASSHPTRQISGEHPYESY